MSLANTGNCLRHRCTLEEASRIFIRYQNEGYAPWMRKEDDKRWSVYCEQLPGQLAMASG